MTIKLININLRIILFCLKNSIKMNKASLKLASKIFDDFIF